MALVSDSIYSASLLVGEEVLLAFPVGFIQWVNLQFPDIAAVYLFSDTY